MYVQKESESQIYKVNNFQINEIKFNFSAQNVTYINFWLNLWGIINFLKNINSKKKVFVKSVNYDM